MILICMLFCISTVSYAADASFSRSDRERIIRLEEGLKATNQRMEDGFKATNQRIDDTNKRIDDLKDSMNNNFKLVMDLSLATLGGIFLLITFVVWARECGRRLGAQP